jgi:prepilin peptidase CpaA
LGQIRLAVFILFAATATYTDFRYRKVPNQLILVASISGMILVGCGGWVSLRGGITGFALGFMLLLPAFLLRMVGGGDVKSLAVTGLFTGPHLLWVSFLLGTAVGGLAAIALLGVGLARRQRQRRQSIGPVSYQGTGARTLPYAAILAMCAVITALFV